MATPSTAAAQTALIRIAGREVEDYNFKIGPVLFNLSAGLSIEYNDNVAYGGVDESTSRTAGATGATGASVTAQDRAQEIARQRQIQQAGVASQSDLIISPFIGLDAQWRLSNLNTLTISMGIGYTKYLRNEELDSSSANIAPSSLISFDVYVGGIRINLHDFFSVQQDPVDEGSLSGVGKFGRFQNSAGLTVYLPLRRDLTVSLGYDHYNLVPFSAEFDEQASSSDTFSGDVAYLLMPALTLGLNGSLTFTRYEGDLNNGSASFFVGAFANFTFSHNLSGRLGAGWQGGAFDDTGENGDTSGLGTWYANFSLEHRVNRYYRQTLGFGREASLGFETNFTELNYFQYGGVITLTPRLDLSVRAFFEDAKESGGIFAESYKRWGGGLGFGFRLTKKVSAAFGYDYLAKKSNIAASEYAQNRYVVTFTYDF